MIKTVSKEVRKYIPESDRNDPKPTTVFFRAMSRGEHDKYLDSITEFKKNRVETKIEKASYEIFSRCLATDEKGVFIYNASIDGVEVPEIKDRKQAIEFLLGIDPDISSEIESAMKGSSMLSEEEEKN